MNYFAHGRRFLDDPYFLAGTAVPDWLNVVNRRAKARSQAAAQWVDDADPVVARVAAGVVQHHFDDRWFHQTRAFVELNLEFAVAIRELLGEDSSFRPSFLGHILVELLLDANLVAADPTTLDRYYAVVDELDPQQITAAVNAMTTQPVPRLAEWIPRFSSERFLYDYADDERLLFRLNHVMKRVRLPELPKLIANFFPEARAEVARRQDELLSGEHGGP